MTALEEKKAKQAAYAHKHYLANRQKIIDRAAQHKKKKRARLAQIVEKFKSRPCSMCGASFPVAAMDCHHSRGKKAYDIAYIVNGGLGQIVLKAELDKCDPVCANCHRIHHAESQAASAVS